jgi:omega-6 fatty acid desaturase (delta-12 desaturase)
VVGFFLHTPLYVPYFSWQLSHSKHHHYTNHMTMDEVFVPPINASASETRTLNARSVLTTAWNTLIMSTIGWPLYLAFNASGPPKKRLVSHFDPWAPIFPRKDWWKIVLTDLGLVAWTYVLYKAVLFFGVWFVVRAYLLPLMVTNFWLVSITFLQHTDESVAHYSPEEWDWMRGALATIDRSLGPWLNYKLHHIVDSHVVHHMYADMPFYNAVEATKHIKPLLGEYYAADPTPGLWSFLKAYWVNMGVCAQVYGPNGVYHFITEEMADK